MSLRAFVVLSLCFVCEVSFADTLVMKSGESKKGKILEETEKTVLFNSAADGAVLEIPKSSVAIIDREVRSDSEPPKGSVQLFSAPPKKKKAKALTDRPPTTMDILLGKQPTEAPKKEIVHKESSLNAMMKWIAEWLDSHPEAQKMVQEITDKLKTNQGEMDKVIKVAMDA